MIFHYINTEVFCLVLLYQYLTQSMITWVSQKPEYNEWADGSWGFKSKAPKLVISNVKLRFMIYTYVNVPNGIIIVNTRITSAYWNFTISYTVHMFSYLIIRKI